MRPILCAVTLVVASVALQQASSQAPTARTPPRTPADVQNQFDPPPDFPPDPPLVEAPTPLPTPSIREPFAIGEALHDPARVPDAVISLLDLMHIGIIGDKAPMQPVQPPMRLRLTESEVRRLIEMGVKDAETEAGIDPAGETFTFKDVHAALAPMLRGMTVDRLAEIYSEYYADRDDSLVKQVLMGQPIEPDMQLSRVQIWLLIADAVMRPPARQARLDGPHLVLARAVLQPGVVLQWGTGKMNFDPNDPFASPDVKLRDAEWREILVRLFVSLQGALTLSPVSAAAHEGHGGPGAPVRFRATLNTSVTPLVSSVTGRVLLTPRSGGIGNVSAEVSSEHMEDHGAVSVPNGATVAFDRTGNFEVTFTPKPERAKQPSGAIMSDTGALNVRIPSNDLLDALYALPPGAMQIPRGDLDVGVQIDIKWHGEETIFVKIHNHYVIPKAIPFGPQTGSRTGDDWAILTLERQDEDTFAGSGVLASKSEIKLRGINCGGPGPWVNQRADVRGTFIPERESLSTGFYNAIYQPLQFEWRAGEKAAEYLKLEFTPVSKPHWWYPKEAEMDKCQQEIGQVNGSSTLMFVPLNDARWTVGQSAGLSLALPDRGDLHYRHLLTKDLVSLDVPVDDNIPTSVFSYSVHRVLKPAP
jgi:hypothetical protein